jgi:hypothetical protein
MPTNAMSQILEQVDELMSRAIGLLLTERSAIDDRLKMLGHDGAAPIPKPRLCGACGSEGHTTRTCMNKKTGAAAPVTQSI